MPFYDYKCTLCENVIESFAKIAERDNPHKCPRCLGPMKRIIAAGPEFNVKHYHPGSKLSLKQRKKIWREGNLNDFRRIN